MKKISLVLFITLFLLVGCEQGSVDQRKIERMEETILELEGEIVELKRKYNELGRIFQDVSIILTEELIETQDKVDMNREMILLTAKEIDRIDDNIRIIVRFIDEMED